MLWSLFPGMHSKLFQFLFLWHLQCTLIPLKQKVFKKYIYIFVHLLFTLKYKTVFKIKYFSCFFFKCTLEGLWKQSLELVYTVLMILICLIQQSTIGEVRSSFSFSFFFLNGGFEMQSGKYYKPLSTQKDWVWGSCWFGSCFFLFHFVGWFLLTWAEAYHMQNVTNKFFKFGGPKHSHKIVFETARS